MAKQKKKVQEENQVTRTVHLGDIAIDSAALLLADPCKVEEVVAGLDPEVYDVQCVRDKHQHKMGIGVKLPTGFGDGLYPVIAEYESMDPIEGDYIARILVEFNHPLRGTGCQHEFPHELTIECLKGNAGVLEEIVA